jgi:cellulose synthase/poly-beta-1,6-N-acetylglucosamine synthase-like glycosyltransferase
MDSPIFFFVFVLIDNLHLFALLFFFTFFFFNMLLLILLIIKAVSSLNVGELCDSSPIYS